MACELDADAALRAIMPIGDEFQALREAASSLLSSKGSTEPGDKVGGRVGRAAGRQLRRAWPLPGGAGTIQGLVRLGLLLLATHRLSIASHWCAPQQHNCRLVCVLTYMPGHRHPLATSMALRPVCRPR